jgi:hypothetical protein
MESLVINMQKFSCLLETRYLVPCDVSDVKNQTPASHATCLFREKSKSHSISLSLKTVQRLEKLLTTFGHPKFSAS